MDYIGKTFKANTRLILPTGHIVEPGEVFRFLAAHASVNVPLWLAAGNAELVDDAPLPIPAGPPKGKPSGAPQVTQFDPAAEAAARAADAEKGKAD
jgi:hypothetical protein